MDSTFVSVRQQGIGAKVKHTLIITTVEEEKLWERDILGTGTPVKRTVFYIRDVFCIRGVSFEALSVHMIS